MRGLRTALRGQGAALRGRGATLRGLGAEPSSCLGFYLMKKDIMSFWVGLNDIHPSPGSKGLREAMDFHLGEPGQAAEMGMRRAQHKSARRGAAHLERAVTPKCTYASAALIHEKNHPRSNPASGMSTHPRLQPAAQGVLYGHPTRRVY